MIVRQGNKWDFPKIILMLRNYKEVSPWKVLRSCEDETYIMKLLTTILVSGCILISEENNEITGMLLALKTRNIWDPSLYEMNELCYWVEPEHRGSTAGYRLIKAYKTICDELKSQNLILSYTISKMVNSPDLKYEKFGFAKEDEKWRQ